MHKTVKMFGGTAAQALGRMDHRELMNLHDYLVWVGHNIDDMIGTIPVCGGSIELWRELTRYDEQVAMLQEEVEKALADNRA